MSATLLLVTIPASHYCEKARWALQRAGLAYHEEGHVPVFSRLATRRLGHASTVPLLLGPTGVITESTEILRFADLQLGQAHRLFPGDPEVDALVQRFDSELGPHTRRLAYDAALRDRARCVQTLGYNVPSAEQTVLRVFFPLLRRLMRRSLRIDAKGVERSRARVDAVFALVAELLADGRPFLTGSQFTAADLTFAALAAPILLPPKYGGRLPPVDAWVPEMRTLVEHYRATPAGQWVLKVYAEERQRAAIAFGG